jgi:hypothetical protein
LINITIKGNKGNNMPVIIGRPFVAIPPALSEFHYKFDDTLQTLALDSGPFGYNGAYINAPTLEVPAIYSGTAVSFDGVDQYMFTDTAVWGTAAGRPVFPMTLSMHFNIASLSSNLGLITTHNDTSRSRGLSAWITTATALTIQLGGGEFWNVSNLRTWSGIGTFSTGTDYHLIIVLEDVDTLTVYLNATAQTVGVPADGGAWTGAFSTSSGRCAIGRSLTGSSGNILYYFDGVIDDVRLYNTVFTPATLPA